MRVKIKNIKRLNISAKKYDITVKENSNFFANDILVHNSYIGVFRHNGEMVVNSKGSFTSPYTIEAKRILEEKYPRFVERFGNGFNSSKVYPFTYCFELIGFEQIVVNYPEPDLILTGIISKKTGNDFTGRWDFVKYDELKKVQKFNGLDWKNVKQLNWENKEGFVVRFSNGQRCKIKFEDYLKLHRQMTNLSTTGIWEALRAGVPVSSILNDVPDEFYGKVREYEMILWDKYFALEEVHKDAFEILEFKSLDRNTFAEMVNNTTTLIKGVLFCMLDGKDYANHIWKSIKPKFEKI